MGSTGMDCMDGMGSMAGMGGMGGMGGVLSSLGSPGSVDVSDLWSRIVPSPLWSHFESLYVANASVGLLPPVCEQIHLGVVDAAQFRTLMQLLHTVGQQCRQWIASGQSTSDGADQRDEPTLNGKENAAAHLTTQPSATDASTALTSDSSDASSASQEDVSSATIALSQPNSAHDSSSLPVSSSTSASPASTSSSSTSSPVVSVSGRPRTVRSSGSGVLSPTSASVRTSGDVSGVGAGAAVERDRFCKPSRLITVYPSKPFLITPVHLERIYVTSRKAAETMADEEKSELATITVRWMGKPTADELFLVATDVCALINIRKSNTAKTVAQFADGEKVSMPVHCSSGKGSSTHILTVLTLAGVRRLLTTSRSVLATSLLEYLTRIAVHLQHFPHYVPVNDPLRPTVTPLKSEQQTQLVQTVVAATDATAPLMPPPPPPAAVQPSSASVAAAPEASMYTALSYSTSDHRSVATSSSVPAFLSTAVVLTSSVTEGVPETGPFNSGSSGSNIHATSSAHPLMASTAELISRSGSTAAIDAADWTTVKREYDGIDNKCSEPQDGDRQKKRRLIDNSSDAAEQKQIILQPHPMAQYQSHHSSHLDNDSPLPLPLTEETAMSISLYGQAMSSSMSHGHQSPSAPDSPSALSYSHYHSSGSTLPSLHFTHSPSFASTQPSVSSFGESDLMYAPATYHPQYYPTSRQHGYYTSPQHRPLTAPPLQPFTHHSMTHQNKSDDEFANSTQSMQQQTLNNTSGLHSPNAAMASAGKSTLHSVHSELTLPPPLYPPISHHSQTATCCTHCQSSQPQHPSQSHHSVGPYNINRRTAPPVSPPPPPSLYSHTAYGHAQSPSVLSQHSSARNSSHRHSQQHQSYISPSPTYAHNTSHLTFQHSRYTAGAAL